MAHTHRRNNKSDYTKSLEQERKKIRKWTKKLIQISDDLAEEIEKETLEKGFGFW